MASTINAKNTSTGVVITPDASGQLELQTADTTRMTIDSSGNVGIGTSSPVSQLHLVSASDSGMTIYKSAVGAGNVRVVTQGLGSALAFGSDTGTGSTERMRIDSSGNVLVGTTSQATTARFTLKAANTGYGGIGVVKSDSSDYWTQNIDSQVGYTFGKNGADFWHAGRGGSNNCVSVNGSWVNSSDVRLKENIKTIPNALENVCKLRGVEFDRKNNGTHEVGLIAQEVQKIYPETIEDNGNYLGLNYGSLIGPLVEAIKQLKAELDTVKAELATLKGTE